MYRRSPFRKPAASHQRQPPIAFHASEIRSGRNFWRKVPDEKRREVLDDLTVAIMNSPDQGRFLYAAAIEKTNALYGEAAVERATQEICNRFDIFLKRQHQGRFALRTCYQPVT